MEEGHAYSGEWNEILLAVRDRAQRAVYEVNEPDFWDELLRARASFAVAENEDVDNTPFTAQEQAEIAEHLDQVKDQALRTPGLLAEQVKAIQQAIEDLKKSSESGKFTRKDWKLLLYGQAANLVFTYAVPPSVAKAIILGALHGLGHLLGLGSLPPSLPPQA